MYLKPEKGKQENPTFLLWFLHLLLMIYPWFGVQSSSPLDLYLSHWLLVFQVWLLISHPSSISINPPHTPWCSTSHQPGCRLSFCWHPDSSGLANKCPTFFYQCRYSKIQKERFARTYCIKLGTQTNAYRGYEVGQGKSNTQGVSELWQTVAMVQPKIFKFNIKMQNTIPAKLPVSASLGAQSATLR